VLMRAVEILEPPHPFAGLWRHYYRAIAIDAPARFKNYTALTAANWNERRDVEKKYSTMTIEEIAALPIKDLAHPDGCHVFAWIPGPHLNRIQFLVKGWGFKYSSQGFTWVKLHRRFKEVPPLFSVDDFAAINGHTTRHNAEICYLARRGNAKRLDKGVRELVIAPQREHSRKPDEIYHRIECYCAGPYLELFARERRPGWDAWGDQVGMFTGAAS
jgi:N6-adenosine-specific RNA methylase IME4